MNTPVKHAGVLYGENRMIYGDKDSRLPKPKFVKVGFANQTNAEIDDDGSIIAGPLHNDDACILMSCGDMKVKISSTQFNHLIGFANLGSVGNFARTGNMLVVLEKLQKHCSQMADEACDLDKEVYRGDEEPMTTEKVIAYHNMQEMLSVKPYTKDEIRIMDLEKELKKSIY